MAVVNLLPSRPTLPRLEEARQLFGHDLPSNEFELRRVYLRLALRYHPDKQPESDRIAATQLFQAIGAVYDELTRSSLNSEAGSINVRVKSPVAAAAELGDLLELRRLLEELPVRASDVDDLGVCILMFAATGGHVQAAKLLLDYNADLHAKNPIGWSVLLYAALGDHADMVSFLVDQGLQVTDHELILAAYTGNSKSLEVLLNLYKGSIIDLRTDSSKKTLLHLACEGLCFLRHSAERHAACVDLVLQQKVPIDVADPKAGRTCLQHFVADVRWRTRQLEHSSHHLQVVDKLCMHGASVISEDPEGNSALSLASKMGLSRVREILFAYQ